MVRDEFDPRDDEELPLTPGEKPEHSGDGESESTEETSGEPSPEAVELARLIERSVENQVSASHASERSAEASTASDGATPSAAPPAPIEPPAATAANEDAPVHVPPGMLLLNRRKLPPPTPFQELVWSFNRKSTGEQPPTEQTPAEHPPEVVERWLPPESPVAPKRPTAPIVLPQSDGTAAVAVTVHVDLAPDARERIAEQSIARAAQTHQNHVEIIAKRLYDLAAEVSAREAERRILRRRGY